MITENKFKGKQRTKLGVQAISDITRAVIILAVGITLLFGSLLKIDFVMQIDSFLRYGFGGISLLYGGFRLYRGIKGERFRVEYTINTIVEESTEE